MNNSTNITFEESDSSFGNAALTEIILDTFYGIIGVTGVLGNFLVILVIIKVKSLRSITNMFIAHQSIIDMMTSLILLILNLGPVIIAPPGPWGTFLCMFWISRYLMWALITVSTLNLVGLTLERYYAIVYPISHHTKFNTDKVKIVFAIEWILGFLVEGYWALIQVNIGGYCIPIWPNVFLQRFCGTMVFAFQFFIPIVVMAMAYIRINLSLASQARSGDTALQRSRRNVIKTLVIVVIAYTICWTPNAFAFYQYNLGGYLDFNSPFTHYTTISAFLNMCINPVIYALKYDNFKKGLRKIFCGKETQITPIDLPLTNSTAASTVQTTQSPSLQVPTPVH
ncbi:galanin receptor 2b-like [Saccoglossus kowalevskii]|uniref:Galanin receptor type 2-like n=1 Tax=Saccoglossus kowalevskii TaxID=10224 RepID=A0ABM0LYR7_SACKO|nr:PREDICTED: galanin receptor type 2-like [Saccoglossus kowalevskii]